MVGGGVCKVIFMSNPTVVLRLGWGFDNYISYSGPPALIEANIQVRSMGPISEMDMVCGSCHPCSYFIQGISELLYGLLLQAVLGGQEALLHRVRGEPHHHHHIYHQAWLLECPGSVCRDAQ